MIKLTVSLISLLAVQSTKKYFFKIPFGIQFQDIMSFVAFIGTGQTHPSRLCSIGSAGAAGKHSLSLHITLQKQTHKV